MASPVKHRSIFNAEVPDVAINYNSNLQEARKGTLLKRAIEFWGPTTGAAVCTLVVSCACKTTSASFEVLSSPDNFAWAASFALKLGAIAALAAGAYLTGEVVEHQSIKAHPINMLQKSKIQLSGIKDWKALALIAEYKDVSGKRKKDLAPQERENLRYVNSRLKKYVEMILPKCTREALVLERKDDVQRFFNVAVLSGVDLWTEEAKPLVRVMLKAR